MEPGTKQMTHTIEVRIPDELLQRLDERVRARGGDRSDYIQEVLEKDLSEPPHAGMTFAELLSLASGPSPAEQMSEEELASFAEAEVRALRAEKRRSAKQG
jgi:Arc/MetJ-type ribon-helix-helix transcriptional regulator